MAKKLRRKIYIIGSIDYESYKTFSEQLTEYEDQDDIPIQIELSSDGGDVHAALAFSARMRLSECHLEVTAVGNVASAATLVLASGDLRKMTKEAWVMVHEEQTEFEGDVTSMERDIKHSRRLEDQWNKLLEKMTYTKAETWAKLNKDTTYLTAEECKALGLIDEVI